MIAHDMKNSLNTILGLSKQRQTLDQKQTNRIHVAGSNILNLVSNMLDVQKFEEAQVSLHKERSLVSAIIDQVKEQMAPLLQSKSTVLESQLEGFVSLSIDPEIINRVLINLITNSVKYSPVGSRVFIKTEAILAQEPPMAIISVIDQGTGVDEDFLPRLFEKFTQSEARSLGTTGSSGLGLHFCKLAIEAHGGKIWAESNAEGGLKVSFSLPLESADLGKTTTDPGGISAAGTEHNHSPESAIELYLINIFEPTRIRRI